MRRAFAVALASAGMMLAAVPVSAQSAYQERDPAEVLKEQLVALQGNPDSLEALISAGYASVALGDLQAAGGFFGRAATYHTNDPRPQAGLGATMAASGDADRALTYFAQAERLGATPAQVGVDRGLAYDLNGQLEAAERDYRAALGSRRDYDARRRLSLNLAMQGDRTGALAFLKPLLDIGDADAQRNRAFVLALTGDMDGARRAFDNAMPGTADRIDPFIRRLALISVPQKAAAVHLGQFPTERDVQMAAAGPPPQQPQATPRRQATPSLDQPSRPVETRRTASAASVEAAPQASQPERRRRVFRQQVVERPTPHGRDRRVQLVEVTPDEPAQQQQPAPATSTPTTSTPTTTSSVQPGLSGFQLPSSQPVAEPVRESRVDTIQLPPAATRNDDNVVANSQPDAGERLASIDTTLSRMPAQISRPKVEVPPAPQPKVETQVSRPKVEAPRPAPKPDIGVEGTHWVQLAGGSRKDAMPFEWRRISLQAGSALNGQSGHVTQGVDYYRLLVGPFPNSGAAQTLVNKLKAEGVDSFSWRRDPAGLKIEKL
ncbi:SPOR domain-containing protein [Sphingomicrobium flavum]|uniref:SPOR domain-containing protein n=1 Tax=Sphingomicrobium flavum TaxID=1229164 RepID=UPI0021AE1FAD|nr:SPOR domain-containing protein [Sphingomicrobium flavum]